MMVQHLGAIHIHRIDGITKRRAIPIAKRLERRPPRRLRFAALLRAYLNH